MTDEMISLRTQLKEALKECEEQARLNGMGSEREARLMAERDAAQRQAIAAERELAITAQVLKNWKDCEFESQVAALTAQLAAEKAKREAAEKGWQCGGPDEKESLLQDALGRADRAENKAVEIYAALRESQAKVEELRDIVLAQRIALSTSPATEKKCGHGPEMLKVVDLYCAQCVEEAK